MPPLSTELRNLLERAIVTARDEAEKAARAALNRLAVPYHAPYKTLSEEEARLRNRLRAEARRLGETKESQNRDNAEPFPALVSEVAYAQWHRMLFARFLAENGLLMHPELGAAVTLEECAEMAADEGEPDAWMLAARYAARMLPGIFRNDDPVMQVRFDAAGRLALERLLKELPAVIFEAEDSLGWVYQFWQTKRKKEVNDGGKKIGGADISPVTQLFTEHYMVQFLLHNSLGAWWAEKNGIGYWVLGIGEGRRVPIVAGIELEYLREEGVKGIGYSVLGTQGLEANLSEPQAPIPNTQYPIPPNTFLGLDASAPRVPAEKAEILRCGPLHLVSQPAQLKNPDTAITFSERTVKALLEQYAYCLHGIKTSDDGHYKLQFWEMPQVSDKWRLCYEAPENDNVVSGQTAIVLYEGGKGEMALSGAATIAGRLAWGKRGVLLNRYSDK